VGTGSPQRSRNNSPAPGTTPSTQHSGSTHSGPAAPAAQSSHAPQGHTHGTTQQSSSAHPPSQPHPLQGYQAT
jgi:hypothetical protein